MSPAPRTTSLIVSGPIGDIEVLIDEPVLNTPEDPLSVGCVAVVCHPHPLFGGTMTNKVAHTLARTFNDTGAVAVRFNFRGVGKSAGTHDDGQGETDDVITMVQWAGSRWPSAEIWLAGFSFGAAMALRASLRATPAQRVVRLVTVAPALRWLTQVHAGPPCPWLIVQGDRDELVDAQAVQQWAAALPQSPQVAILPGAEHFFHGRLNELRNAVHTWLDLDIQLGSNVQR
jgi:alpha/beta superfamily hydrolase